MICCKKILKSYGERTVLDIKELTVNKGEKVALIGANGSGKSTLLRVLAGIVSYDGEISIDGKVLYMPQKNTAFDMSVLGNVTYSLTGKRRDKEERAMEALRKTGLSALYKKNALSLSGGETARLSLARLLVNDCDILLLDEPTAAVDIEGSEIIENAVNEYVKEKGCTLITATHSPVEASRLSDRVILLDKGIILEDEGPEEFILSPKSEFGKKFVDMWRMPDA